MALEMSPASPSPRKPFVHTADIYWGRPHVRALPTTVNLGIEKNGPWSQTIESL